MNSFLKLFILILMGAVAYGREVLPEIHKSSKTQLLCESDEVIAFYTDLIEHNPQVKRRLDSIIKKHNLENDPRIGPEDTAAIEWFPRIGNAPVSENLDVNTRFLVVQPIALRRFGELQYISAAVSEFQVIHKGHLLISRADDQHPKVVDNEITIKFLGFRDLKLTSMSH